VRQVDTETTPLLLQRIYEKLPVPKQIEVLQEEDIIDYTLEINSLED
jgi:hypothetical protein